MKILILGGTKFLGRALVDAARAAGHEVTLFNRGTTNPNLYPDVEKLRGDRDGDLSALEGRQWDAVIDTCGYVPRIVAKSAQLLAESTGHYTFISSISVYSYPVKPGVDESADLNTLPDPTVEEVTGETYGGLKVLCEAAAEAAMPGRVLQVRAGLIVGPYDPTDRFTYWPVRAARGGRMLVPPADSPCQLIDVRDLAAWIIAMIEDNKTGIYNATGPAQPYTFGELMQVCRTAGENVADLVEVSEDFIVEHEIAPWTDLPLWLPSDSNGLTRASIDRALRDGLTFRPPEETVHATLSWYQTEYGLERPLNAGLRHDRETDLLDLL